MVEGLESQKFPGPGAHVQLGRGTNRSIAKAVPHCGCWEYAGPSSPEVKYSGAKVRFIICAMLCADDCWRKLILDYNKATDPVGVAARRAGCIRRRVFYAAGVNHIWAFDQHDKWKRFGLRFHLGVEPFTGFLLWLIVWWTNSNPKLVGQEYFQAARKYGGKCLFISGNVNTVTLVWKAFRCWLRVTVEPKTIISPMPKPLSASNWMTSYQELYNITGCMDIGTSSPNVNGPDWGICGPRALKICLKWGFRIDGTTQPTH